jgi:hypothetical protein
MTVDFIECTTCSRWFNNTDGTMVCPNGHENLAEDFLPAHQAAG